MRERCAAARCGRWTRAGEPFCTRHGGAGEVPAPVAVESVEPPDFAALLETGDYAALLGDGLRGTLRGAAADTGLEVEIGALRLALARLLQAERDPTKLATGVARVAAVAVQAARLRQGADSGDDLHAALLRELAALDDDGGDAPAGAQGETLPRELGE